MTRKYSFTRTTLSVSALTLLFTSALLFAGPLNPPAGPVTSTPGPEPRTVINAANTPGDADSLFKITQPGSYYLTGNITGVTGKHGIEIVASGVTLDLNGFDLNGVAGSLDGVSTTVSHLTSIAVLNGSIRNWGDEGVDASFFTTTGCRIERVHASANLGSGIAVGPDARVSHCAASGNGVSGIRAGSGSRVSDCVAFENVGDGINTGSSSAVTGCTARDNTLTGILVGLGSTVSACTSQGNDGSGISTGVGCTIVNSAAYSNLGSGFAVGGSGTITNCTARFNTRNGISVTSGVLVLNNTCSNNRGSGGDGAGINATAGDNRIEGNVCTSNDRGIDIDAAGNIIIKNTCTSNLTNWTIAAGNSIGAIVVAGTNGAAVNGNGPIASTLGSTDPNANFTY